MPCPHGRAKSALTGDLRHMFLNRPFEQARASVPRFLLGAGCGALLVLSFAGASLALSGAGSDRWKPNFNELRLNYVPQAALRLGCTA